ncbi:MAG: hypothetical protein AMXMBFR56_68410 [Polyangiaceae bacterium]
MTDDIPRRSQLHLMTPPENAIYNAMCVVEQAGCDVRLTEAVNLLQKARDRVADFVDGVEHPLVSYPKSEPEVLLQVIAEREDWRMREGRAQHEKALAQKRIKSLEDGIVAENKRTSVIEQELQAVKDVLIARDEDFHPEGLVSVAVVVARILNERDQADERASTATDVLCGALGPDHGRGGLVEHCQKAAEKIAELERDFATLAALNKSNADELARQMDLRERGVPAPRFTDSRQQAIAEAVLYSDCLRRSEGEEVAAKAKLAELRADQRATGDVLAAILGRERCEDGNVRLANDVALKVEGIEDQIRSVRSAVDALALYVESGFSNKNSGGSGAAHADVAQRGQSNEGTHGPLDRPASPEPAGGPDWDAKRDLEWILAMAQALGTDSKFNVPIRPDVEVFRKLFEQVRARASVHAEWAEIPRPANLGSGLEPHLPDCPGHTQAVFVYVVTGMCSVCSARVRVPRPRVANGPRDPAMILTLPQTPQPKLTELVSREQLVAACREALKSPSWWGAFEKLACVLEG